MQKKDAAASTAMYKKIWFVVVIRGWQIRLFFPDLEGNYGEDEYCVVVVAIGC